METVEKIFQVISRIIFWAFLVSGGIFYFGFYSFVWFGVNFLQGIAFLYQLSLVLGWVCSVAAVILFVIYTPLYLFGGVKKYWKGLCPINFGFMLWGISTFTFYEEITTVTLVFLSGIVLAGISYFFKLTDWRPFIIIVVAPLFIKALGTTEFFVGTTLVTLGALTWLDRGRLPRKRLFGHDAEKTPSP